MATKYIRNDNNYDSYLFIAGIDTKYTVLIQPKKCKYFLWLLITKIKFTILFGTAKELFWPRKTNLTRKRNFPIKYAKIYSFNHKLWGIKFAFFFSGSHHTLEYCFIRLTLQAQEKLDNWSTRLKRICANVHELSESVDKVNLSNFIIAVIIMAQFHFGNFFLWLCVFLEIQYWHSLTLPSWSYIPSTYLHGGR